MIVNHLTNGFALITANKFAAVQPTNKFVGWGVVSPDPTISSDIQTTSPELQATLHELLTTSHELLTTSHELLTTLPELLTT
mgnify:CR=1 FL=1